LAERLGGVTWRSELAERLGGVGLAEWGWRSVLAEWGWQGITEEVGRRGGGMREQGWCGPSDGSQRSPPDHGERPLQGRGNLGAVTQAFGLGW
jgi:hypothetical protein